MPNVDGTNEDEPIARIVVLEDTDNDGQMDSSTVFLDKLVMPRAIAIVKGGILIAEPPTLWFCEDLDGDLKSDRKTKVADYATLGAVEHMENGLMPGIDNWLYNVKSNRRMKWDGTKLQIEETATRGQWGMTMDDYGRLLYTTNSNPALADFQPYEYSNRNPGLQSKAGLNRGVASDRLVFSNRVNPGVNRGYRSTTLRSDHRLRSTTAVSGLAIYRGTQYPQSYYGNLFTTEPAANAVMRYRIVDHGFEFTASKQLEDDPIWEKVEFLVSTDERFRPVTAATGPDGYLYIVDLYRGILQHKEFVTTFLRKQILERELDKPTGLGRIYRIVHEDDPEHSTWPKLSTLSDLKLVKQLANENGWIRDTAQRLLVDKIQINAKAQSALEKATSSTNELEAIHALWTLEGRGTNNASTLARALQSPSAWVRVHAIRSGESELAKSPIDAELLKRFEECLVDSEFRVRLQAVQSLSVMQNSAFILQSIKRIFTPDIPSEYTEDAIVSSLSGHELDFATLIIEDPKWLSAEGRINYLEKLAGALFQKRDTQSLFQLAALFSQNPTDWKANALMEGIANAAGRPEARPIKLDAQPSSFYAIIDSLPQDGKINRDNLGKTFSWPGKASDNPLDNLNQEQLAFVESGKAIYAGTCAACHQNDGNGMPGLAPALNGSRWVTESKERLALIVTHGISGPIDVKGTQWNSVMPAHGLLSPLQGEGTAQVLSYIRSAWGNKADIVSKDEIQPVLDSNKTRAMPWTAKELDTISLKK